MSLLLAECRQRCPGATYVFQSRRGTEPSPVGVRSLQYVLSRLVERCELKVKRITLTALRKSRPFIPGSTPNGFPRGEEQEDTCAVTAALETAEQPWESVQDSAADHDRQFLDAAPPDCLAFRRQFVSAVERTKWPCLRVDSAQERVETETERDVVEAFCRQDGVGLPVSHVAPAQDGETTVTRGSRSGPILLFPAVARSA